MHYNIKIKYKTSKNKYVCNKNTPMPQMSREDERIYILIFHFFIRGPKVIKGESKARKGN